MARAYSLDEMIDYHNQRLAYYTNVHTPHAAQRARREQRLLDALLRLKKVRP